jgi:hypothetical protein
MVSKVERNESRESSQCAAFEFGKSTQGNLCHSTMLSRPNRRAGPWWNFTAARGITILFLIQVAAVLYFLMIPTPPLTPPSHHHGVHNPNDYIRTHNFIIIGILSDRTASERRDAVRETWLRLYKPGLG